MVTVSPRKIADETTATGSSMEARAPAMLLPTIGMPFISVITGIVWPISPRTSARAIKGSHWMGSLFLMNGKARSIAPLPRKQMNDMEKDRNVAVVKALRRGVNKKIIAYEVEAAKAARIAPVKPSPFKASRIFVVAPAPTRSKPIEKVFK